MFLPDNFPYPPNVQTSYDPIKTKSIINTYMFFLEIYISLKLNKWRETLYVINHQIFDTLSYISLIYSYRTQQSLIKTKPWQFINGTIRSQ